MAGQREARQGWVPSEFRRDMAKFNPPGHRYGKQKIADTYPDVVGELARAEKGLGAPSERKVVDRFPIIGREEQRRAGDRAVAKSGWKPPVDRPPGAPASDEYPRIVVPGRYDDPKKRIRVPPVLNPDGTVWKPPVDRTKPRAPRDEYPQVVGMTKVGRVKKFRPPHPKSDWNYRTAKSDPDTQYVANCLGLTGEMMRSVLSYDPVMGELTWLRGSGPRTGQTVPHNINCVVTYKSVPRNVFGVIYLIVLDQLPNGWVQPENGAWNDWSWDNIKPTARNRC